MISSQIEADSVNSSGNRITTFNLRIPKSFVLGQLTRHRIFSFSVQSSRACPVQLILDQVKNDPYIPMSWGKNCPGMSPKEEIIDREELDKWWLSYRDDCVRWAESFKGQEVAKEITNRVLENFMYCSVILTGTDFRNFFDLRCSDEAQYEIRYLANLMQIQYNTSQPEQLRDYEWHLPFITKEEKRELLRKRKHFIEKIAENQLLETRLAMVSASRAARVSYHREGILKPIEEEIKQASKLIKDKHWSPLEAASMALPDSRRIRNFTGFRQLRDFFDNAKI